MKTILPILLTLLLSSCLTDSRINKQIAKATPERVLGLIQNNYPHLFTTRIDTIRDTVSIKTLRVDTVLTISQLSIVDTVTIYKDRLKTKVWLKHDSIFIENECLGDTIYIERIVRTEFPSQNYNQSRWWVIPLGLTFCFFILVALILLGLWLDKRHKTNNRLKN